MGTRPLCTLCSGLTLTHPRYHLGCPHPVQILHRCAECCWPHPLTAPGTMRAALTRCCVCLASCTSCSTLDLMYKDGEVPISHQNQQNSNTSSPSLIYSVGSSASGSFLISKHTKVNKKINLCGSVASIIHHPEMSRISLFTANLGQKLCTFRLNSWTECASRCGNQPFVVILSNLLSVSPDFS